MTEGHAFICYVREDRDGANYVTALLKDAGIPVWRDTESLWVGEDWRQKIRSAITSGAFAFIPLFSSTGVGRGTSGQYEELYLAADEMRKRPPESVWILPVRFDECDLPNLNLGGGRLLGDIQRGDLFGDRRDQEASRLVAAVRRIVDGATNNSSSGIAVATNGGTGPQDVTSSLDDLKRALRDPAGDIILHDLVVPVADSILAQLTDADAFPAQGSVHALELADQVATYCEVLDPLLDVFVVGGTWSRPEHDRVWREVMRRICWSKGDGGSGNSARLAVRWFPLLLTTYTAGLAATYSENFGFLRALLVDTTLRERDGETPVVNRAHPYYPFGELALTAQVIALQASGEVVDQKAVDALATGSRGKRHTPTSDYLHDSLRERFRSVIPHDEMYSENFDRFELILGMLLADQKLQSDPDERGPWSPGAYAGRFTWRDRFARGDKAVEDLLCREIEGAGDGWVPVVAGLFGGDAERAAAACGALGVAARVARQHRF